MNGLPSLRSHSSLYIVRCPLHRLSFFDVNIFNGSSRTRNSSTTTNPRSLQSFLSSREEDPWKMHSLNSWNIHPTHSVHPCWYRDKKNSQSVSPLTISSARTHLPMFLWWCRWFNHAGRKDNHTEQNHSWMTSFDLEWFQNLNCWDHCWWRVWNQKKKGEILQEWLQRRYSIKWRWTKSKMLMLNCVHCSSDHSRHRIRWMEF